MHTGFVTGERSPLASSTVDPSDGQARAELAGHLRFAVARLARRMRQQNTGLLSATMGAALFTIDREGSLSLGELASLEQMTPPSVTNIVTKLEGLGMVSRHEDPTDRRVVLVQTTDAAKAYLEADRAQRTEWLMNRLATLDEHEVGVLTQAVALLERLAGPGEQRS